MNTNTNMSEQSGQTEQSGSQSTTMERTEKNKYKIPILSDREINLTQINPRMWRGQISEYIDLTYHRNLEDLLDHGIEGMDDIRKGFLSRVSFIENIKIPKFKKRYFNSES